MTVASWIIEAHKSGAWLDTRGAGKRRVICVDAPGEYPVIVVDHDGEIFRHYGDGTYNGDNDSIYDLIPPKREWEVYVMETPDGHAVASLEPSPMADSNWKLLARATLREGDV